ncbi:MAG: LemA family protein [Muribaculaceae bacterium]|nr:LemA family protein [Muribaculaceae bacterium]MDE5595289.1 LemA family protein [Muribaculaceae bacterium]
MKKSTITLVVVICVIAMLCGVGCSNYNSLVSAEQDVDKAWADVQTQYQRRFDLIPNLVETVKGYAAHEKETFENVTLARAGLTNAYNTADSLKNVAAPADMAAFEKYNASQAELNRAFNVYVNAVREAYPDLKANEQFLSLQDQLEGTENRIATYRGYYTESVQKYNLKVKRFPGNIFAGLFGFSEKAQFEAEAQAQSAPKVQF